MLNSDPEYCHFEQFMPASADKEEGEQTANSKGYIHAVMA
jgi:hypothetical protein